MINQAYLTTSISTFTLKRLRSLTPSYIYGRIHSFCLVGSKFIIYIFIFLILIGFNSKKLKNFNYIYNINFIDIVNILNFSRAITPTSHHLDLSLLTSSNLI